MFDVPDRLEEPLAICRSAQQIVRFVRLANRDFDLLASESRLQAIKEILVEFFRAGSKNRVHDANLLADSRHARQRLGRPGAESRGRFSARSGPAQLRVFGTKRIAEEKPFSIPRTVEICEDMVERILTSSFEGRPRLSYFGNNSETSDLSSFSSLIVPSILPRLNSLIGSPSTISSF